MEDQVKQRRKKLADLVQRNKTRRPPRTISEFIAYVREKTQSWQKEDLIDRQADDELILNNARIVDQVWFRGHRDCLLSLKPGIYRAETTEHLAKRKASRSEEDRSRLFDELMDLEHELRIDFISYGHLLNQLGQAKSQIDWYFLMQHHGVPTRLLDWTTNALAALFFALNEYSRSTGRKAKTDCVAIWMIDAYWLAMRCSDDWSSPLLPWSEDASRYLPKLEDLIDKEKSAKALIPDDAMPIEPPAIHPRVAAQEGRFIIFGRKHDLLEHKIELAQWPNGKSEDPRIVQIRFEVGDLQAKLEELANLGMSRRTLFPDLDGLADYVRWKHFHKVGGYNLETSGG
jgi:FRG domain